MILKFHAPLNQNVEELFEEWLKDKGLSTNMANELKTMAFLICDAEIHYRFPDYDIDVQYELSENLDHEVVIQEKTLKIRKFDSIM